MRRITLLGLGWVASVALAQAEPPPTPVILAPVEDAGPTAPPAPKVTQIDVDYGVRLTFDEPMLTWNDRTAVAALRLEPAVACTWYWEDDTTLSCNDLDVSRQFRRATDYTLHIGEGLWSQAGVPLAPVVLHDETERPSLEVDSLEWHGSRPTLAVASAMPLDSASLQQSLDVTFDGRPVPFRVERLPDGKNWHGAYERYRIAVQEWPEAQGVLAVHVHAGLRSTEGPLPGTEAALLAQLVANEPFGVRDLACSTWWGRAPAKPRRQRFALGDCMPEAPVSVELSQCLAADALAALALPPGWKATQQAAYDGYDRYYGYGGGDYGTKQPRGARGCTLYLQPDGPAQAVAIKLPAGLASADGSPLAESVTLRLGIADAAPTARAAPQVLVQGIGGDALPQVTTRNIDRDIEIRSLAVGTQATFHTDTLPRPPVVNTDQVLAAPPPDATVRATGGLVFAGGVRDYGIGYALVYAPFDVVVRGADDGRSLVWASRWGDGAGVGDATVELVTFDFTGAMKVQGQARTDADGVAWLDGIADGGFGYGAQTYVRVTHGGKQTLTPAPRWDAKLALPQRRQAESFTDEADQFGVTDRPLYRPGETVQYRLWLRTRDRNHLVQRKPADKPLAFQLANVPDGKVFANWTGTPDALGSLHGAVTLPVELRDGFYCVQEDDSGWLQGACFKVARFEAQALWVTLAADRPAVVGGDELVLEATAGFFSGGPAPGSDLEFDALLNPQRFEDAYPDFGAYEFVDPYGENGAEGAAPLRGVATPKRLGADGTARFRWRLPETILDEETDDAGEHPPIPFGRLEVSVSAGIRGRATASSAPVTVAYARFPRYVGLRSDAWWWPLDRDLALDAVVVTHTGTAVPGVPVQVRLETLPDGDDDEATTTPTVIGTCTLLSGTHTPCALRPPAEGRYRVVATAEGAAPTELARYAGGHAPAEGAEKERPSASLSLVRAADAGPAQVRLLQPYPRARVLFTLEYSGIYKHWVQTVEGTDVTLDVPLDPAWAPAVTLHAVVHRADGAADDAKAAFVAPTLGAFVDLEVPVRRQDAFEVTATPVHAAPGQALVLHLRNPGPDTQHATITVVDDSIYQQGVSELRNTFDPQSGQWLGQLAEWRVGSWYGLENFKAPGNPFYQPPTKEEAAREARRNARRHGRKPPAPVASDGDSREIDEVVVTGSRIPPGAKFSRSAAAEPRVQQRAGRAGKPMARVRRDFRDTAYWNPDVEVAGGATRTLTVPLPDNLTRWRVLVWSSDARDGFALTESTVDSSLPVEVRIGAPERLFVDDLADTVAQVRNHHRGAAAVGIALQANGAGVQGADTRQATVAAEAELLRTLRVAPTTTGDVQLLVQGDSPHGHDALAQAIAVQPRELSDQVMQIGWLEAEPRSLALPGLPEGAFDARMELEVARGFDTWRAGWLRDLRDYPHRCWEQMLSRAVGAALARAQGDAGVSWPQAQTEIDNVLRSAPSFQDEDGGFHYFLGNAEYWRGSSPTLSAYTLQSFDLLRALGHPVPDAIYDPLAARVATATNDAPAAPTKDNAWWPAWEIAAVSAGALDAPKGVDAKSLQQLWLGWENLSWHGRAELVRALSRQPALRSLSAEGVQRLRDAGTPRDKRRVIADTRDFTWAMGSNLRDQCAVVEVLFAIDTDPAGEAARIALLRGVRDLFAGGTPSLDTQSAVRCLRALHAAQGRLRKGTSAPLPVRATLGAQATTLTLPAGTAAVRWAPVGTVARDETLVVAAPKAADPTVNYAATLRYRIDALKAPPQAIGLRLERRYEVLRDGAWAPMPAAGVHAGDWVRVALRVTAPAWRKFVAITDPVPGGLVTRDVQLLGVGSVELVKLGDTGSWWFDSRQTGASEVRLYALDLPPGQHEVYYFAQAVHTGDFLAPPAVAELMYGRGTRATTQGERVEVSP
jgi:hypothetical protein